MRSGLAADDVRRRLEAAALPRLGSVVSLYGWHDGTELPGDGVLDDVELIPGFVFVALGDAIEEVEQRASDGNWGKWLPVLADGGGCFYVVDLSSDVRQPVLRWEFDDPTRHPTAFEDVEAMFATIARALDDGVIYVDDRGYLETDQTQFETLCA